MRAGITFFVSGCILIVFGTTMIIPGILDFSDGNTASARSFWQAAGVTFFFGVLFVATFYDKYEKLTVREMVAGLFIFSAAVFLCSPAFKLYGFFF